MDKCKPLARGHGEAATALAFTADCGRLITGRGLHSSRSQLNLSRVRLNKTPYTP